MKNLLKKGLLAAALLGAGQTLAASPEENKANVLAFYDLAFNQHQAAEAAQKYIGKEYLQHNPGVADGADAFVNAIGGYVKQFPQSRAEVKQAVAEGNLVVLHVHSRLTPDDRGRAVVDIFRFDDEGKIVEHWDVIQTIPEQTASGRGMF